MTEKKDWLTSDEVVKEFGHSVRWWRARAKAGDVVARTDSRPFMFERASLVAFMRGKRSRGTEANTSEDKEEAELNKEIALYDLRIKLADLRQEAESKRLGYPDFEKFEEERDSLAERIANLEQREGQVRQVEATFKQREASVVSLADRVNSALVSMEEAGECMSEDYEQLAKVYEQVRRVATQFTVSLPPLALIKWYEHKFEGGLPLSLLTEDDTLYGPAEEEGEE